MSYLFKAIPASSGIAIGKSLIKKENKVEINKEKISAKNIKKEIDKFEVAVNEARETLKKIKNETSEKMGQDKAEIFDAHLMILDDPELIAEIENKIREYKLNAAAAIKEVIDDKVAIFENMDDEYLKERGADINDVGMRIIKNILNIKDVSKKMNEKAVIVAKDLTPSDTAQLNTDKVLAFITKDGSKTSHSAIMARSLGIPAVVGLGEELFKKVENNKKVIVDGNNGIVILEPGDTTLEEYNKKLKDYKTERKRLKKFKNKKAKTKDGEKIEVAGNIGNEKEADIVLENGGEGIGLFRTEFLFMDRENIPSKEEQFETYKNVAKKMNGETVLIRTLDVGGDKNIPYLNLDKEMNPFLGYRAIRLCLDRKEDIFKPQLKAILKASNYGNIKMMYPFISSYDELTEANQVLEEAKKELELEGIKYNKDMEVGVMIETPAAVMLADKLAKKVDFFSIGTNDLIQYTNAVDRTNEKISKLHTSYHPGVLKLIKKTIDIAHKYNIWVGMCGAAAGNKLLFPFLLGVGLDEFSMSASSIPEIKEIMIKWTRNEAEEYIEEILDFNTAKEVKKYLEKVKK